MLLRAIIRRNPLSDKCYCTTAFVIGAVNFLEKRERRYRLILISLLTALLIASGQHKKLCSVHYLLVDD